MIHATGRNGRKGPWIALGAACLLALGACGKKAPEEGTAVLTSDSGLLRYVPADTPYVFAWLEPAPDDFSDKVEPKVDQLLRAYHRWIEITVANTAADWTAETGETPPETVNAVVAELGSLMSIDGLESAGITRGSTSVFYGNGLLPVLRMTLSDAAAFDAALARIEEKAEAELPVAEIDGNTYRYVDADEMRIVIATIGDQLVITLTPTGFDDEQLGALLGLTLPDENIADSGELQAIASEYGFEKPWLGMLSTERLAATFIDAPGGLDAALLSLFEYDATALSDVCKDEMQALAAVAPRIVIGFSEISVDEINEFVVVELRDDIASGLAAIPAAVPGLGTVAGGFASFGMGLNVQAARDFYAARLDAMAAEPYECELLAGLQGQVEAGRQAMNAPVPPIVYGLRGFVAVINELEGFDPENPGPPESIDASFVLAVENAPALLALGQMWSPDLATMDIEPDGTPHPLPLPLGQPGLDSSWLALTDASIGIAVGPSAETSLPGLLQADASSPPPVMSISIDAGQYYKLIATSIAAPADEGEPMDPEMQAVVVDILTAVSELYDRMSVDVALTARGIEVVSIVTLAE